MKSKKNRMLTMQTINNLIRLLRHVTYCQLFGVLKGGFTSILEASEGLF